MRGNKTLVTIVGLLMLTGCHHVPQNNDVGSAHFQYEQQEDWVQVSGQMQSPINIITKNSVPLDKKKDLGVIEVAYNNSASNISNNGHSIEVSHGGRAKINGRSFELMQFHFHAPGEHTIDEEAYPLEAHFVHKGQDGRLAVIAVFFTLGQKNKSFDTVLRNIDNELSIITLDPHVLMPKNKSYYHYLGSLTTPPLTENVEWYVMKAPVAISAEQLREFQTLYEQNNRAIQPLNERVVLSFDA